MKAGWILIFLMVFFELSAQTPSYNPVLLSREFSINEIKQDSFGFLWMATDKGILFYNGLEDYLVEDDLSMPGSTVSLEIAGLHAYAGREKGVIEKIDIRSKNIIKRLELNTETNITDLEIIGEDKLIAASYGNGIFFMNKDTITNMTETSGLSSDYVYEIRLLSDNRLFIATDRGIDIIDVNGKYIEAIEHLPDVIITNLSLARNNLIWASSYDQGIFSVHTKTFAIQNYPFEEKQRVHDLLVNDDFIIVSTDEGLFQLNEKTDFTSFFENAEPDQRIQSLLIDQENNIWLGGNKDLLWKASLYFRMLELEGISGMQAIHAADDYIWLGLSEGLVKCKRNDPETKYILKEKNITCLKHFDDHLWVGTYSNGIFIIDPEDNIQHHLDDINKLSGNTILDIEKTGTNMVAVSTLSGVANVTYSLDRKTKKLDKVTTSNELGQSYVMDIFCDAKGTVWCGKDKAGIKKVATDQISEFNKLPGTSTKLGSVYSIAEAEDGSIWFSSTNHGLISYSEDTMQIIDNIKNIDDPYTSIIALPNNNLLLIRASSIDLFDVSRRHIMYFDIEAGLKPEPPFLNNYSKSGNQVWFVHHDKIYLFDAPKKGQKIHPTTSIDRIEVNLDLAGFHQNAFEQTQNNFRFLFTGGWLTDPAKLSYLYILEGYDQDWRQTRDRIVTYPHLPPGKYVFRVKAAENENFSDEPITEYNFRIKRAFYNTIWFYIFITACIAYLIYWLIKRNQRETALKARLDQKQIETQLINLKAQLNPHFLFNSFNTLTGLIEETPEKGVKYIEYLTDFYRSILDIGDEKLISIDRELELVRLYESLLKERFGKGFLIRIDHFDKHVLIPPLTLQMLIENAIKHNQVSQKHPLNISIYAKAEHIVVSNNKIPKNNYTRSTGLGLKNIMDRYRLLQFPQPFIEETDKFYKVLLPIEQKKNGYKDV